MKQKTPKLESLLKIESLDKYTDDEAIQIIGTIQDLSYEMKLLEGMNHALKLADSINKRDFSKFHSAYFNYTVANIWFDRYKLLNPGKSSWQWDSEDYNQMIIYYRKALKAIQDVNLSSKKEKFYYCQISTNLANNLSHLGRIIEAIEYWNDCLVKDKSFGMAKGNLGYGLTRYSSIIYDDGHKAFILREAYKHLSGALKLDITPEAKSGFEKNLKNIKKRLKQSFLEEVVNLNGWNLGSSKEEIEYREWCLQNRLFLNPLNELGSYSISARDVLYLPSIVTKIDEKPFHFGLFNVIKQEYVSARYLLYESRKHAESGKIHYSDKDNFLADTLDYSFHSLGIEKKKLAFRAAYSILDKIAFFLNEYFELGVNQKSVKFRTIWYDSGSVKNGIREQFKNYTNWPLRGLFWLSKDLFEETEEFKDCLEPDAKEINEIRNHLEHKYLKVHMFGTADLPPFSSDDLSFSISRDTLYEKTLRMLKLSRTAVMYLTFTIHVEEYLREQKRDPSFVTAPMFMTGLFDDLRY